MTEPDLPPHEDTHPPREETHAEGTRLKTKVASWVDAYVAFSARRGGTILLLAFALGALSLLASLRISIDARVESLLPQGTPSALAVNELRARTSTDSPLYLLIQSSDPALNRRLAQQLREQVATWKETEWVIDQRDPAFFLDHRLLYVPSDELAELADRVEQIVEFEECAAIPGCVNLDERPSVPTEQELHAMFERVPDVRALASLFGSKSLEPSNKSEPGNKDATGAQPQTQQRVGELCSADGTVCAVQAVLSGDPLNLDYAEVILKRTDALFAAVRPADAPADLKLAISGQYRDAPMTQRVVIEDLAKTGVLSTFLLFLVLVPLFRGWRALVVLGVPLLLGTAYTFGVLGLVYPRLNLISAFTLAILAGVGVDFGIHLLSHFGLNRDQGQASYGAIASTLKHLLGSMTMAAITTATGFAALAPASFRGFSEMGLISAGGIFVAVLTFILLLPPTILFLEKVRPSPVSMVRTWRFTDKLRAASTRTCAVVVVLGLLLSAVLGFVGLRGVDFEYDFRKLRPATVHHGIAWGKALHGTSRSAVYLLADEPADLEKVAAQLRQEGPGSMLNSDQPWLITPRSFVPPEQDVRLKAIARLRESAKKARDSSDPELVKQLNAVAPLLEVRSAITDRDLPQWVQGWFLERDQRFGNLGVMFTDYSGADARQMEALSRQLNDYRKRFPEVRFASSVALLGEVVPSLRRDGPEIFGLAVLGLSLAVLLVRRSLIRLVTVLAPLALCAALTTGLLVLLDIRINFYNMLVFPLAVGMGIDGSIYVVEAVLDTKRLSELWTAARAVMGATLATLVAFGSLAIATNPGLVSLAKVAVISMGSTLVVNLLWLPPCLWLIERWRASRRGPE